VFTARYGLYVYVMHIKPSKPSGHYMYHQFNINNSTFCPYSVFMCFVWISEQTAIISPQSINWLVFKTEMECVYWAVRAVFSCTVEAGFILQSVSMEAANRRFVAPDRSLSYPTLAYANSRVFTVQQFQQG